MFLAGNTWTETGITWNTRPARFGAGIDDIAKFNALAWVDFDVTSLVDGNGTFTFSFAPQSSDAAIFNSREASSNRPQLIVSYGSGVPTSTSTASATASPTSTPTATMTATAQPTALPTASPTQTAAATGTVEPTLTATFTATPAPATETPIPAPTATPTLTPSTTPVPTATATAAPAVLFADGFESGTLSGWQTIKGLVVQQGLVLAGSFAARGTSTSAATYARVNLGAPRTDLYFRTFINIQSQSNASVYFMRFRTASDASFLGIFSSGTGKIGYRNDVSGVRVTTTTTMSKGVWHEMVVHVIVNSGGGLVEIWLDDVLVVSTAENLGTNPTQIIQIGENGTGARSYDIGFDDVLASTAFIALTGAPSGAAQSQKVEATAAPIPTAIPTETATVSPTATPAPSASPTVEPTIEPTSTETPVPLTPTEIPPEVGGGSPAASDNGG